MSKLVNVNVIDVLSQISKINTKHYQETDFALDNEIFREAAISDKDEQKTFHLDYRDGVELILWEKAESL